MKISKIIALSLALCVMLTFCAGCSADESANDVNTPPPSDDEAYEGETFVLKATVISVTDRLEVEVIESDYAFGVYWVLISDSTKYENIDGQSISLSDIQPGNTIEIVYNGQTMMSYPPQIVALKVTLL